MKMFVTQFVIHLTSKQESDPLESLGVSQESYTDRSAQVLPSRPTNTNQQTTRPAPTTNNNNNAFRSSSRDQVNSRPTFANGVGGADLYRALKAQQRPDELRDTVCFVSHSLWI